MGDDELGEFEEYCADPCGCGESSTTSVSDEVKESTTTSDPDESSTTSDSDEKGDTEPSFQDSDEDQWMKVVVIVLAVLLVITIVVILYLVQRNMRYMKLQRGVDSGMSPSTSHYR